MSLTQLWKNDPNQIEKKNLHQIISFAGEGKLKDNNSTSIEFREFIQQIPSDLLCGYLDSCLENGFQDSGFALQDLVNQVGERLGFTVQYGRYRGTKAHSNEDGLWCFPNGHKVIIEVKTTDTYRIETDKIADYRKNLIRQGALEESQSSILVIVGRQDTGELEAQIRGSRHAWDIRIISVNALKRLLRLRESVDNPQIIVKICEILIPREFTRLDEIIDIAFFAVEETKTEEISVDETFFEKEKPELVAQSAAITKPVSFHDTCIEAFRKKRGLQLIKQSKSFYISADKSLHIVCAVSKNYNIKDVPSFWFAFHPHQKNFLEEAATGFLLLGCGSSDIVLSIPIEKILSWLESLWTTEQNSRMYWHLRMHQKNQELVLHTRKGFSPILLNEFLLNSDTPSSSQ